MTTTTEDFSHLSGTSDQGECDEDVMKHGFRVFMTHTLSAAMIEEWVKRVRAAGTGYNIDWHYIGGRASVLATGDIESCRAAIRSTRHVHDAMFRTIMGDRMKENGESYLAGIWDYNGLGE